MAKLHVSLTHNKQLGFSINVKPLTLDSVMILSFLDVPGLVSLYHTGQQIGCHGVASPPAVLDDPLETALYIRRHGTSIAADEDHTLGVWQNTPHICSSEREVLRNANIAAQSSSNELNVNGDGKHWQVYCFSKGEVEPEVLISVLDGVSTSRLSKWNATKSWR